jgi:hypothetical protein
MPLTVTLTPEKDYLRAEVRGERSVGSHARDMIAGLTEVAERCRATGLRRVLGVVALTGAAPAIDAFEIGKALPSLFTGVVDRFAFVVHDDAETLQTNRFVEDVAVNRGVRAQMFVDEDSARRWLLAP